MSFKEFTKSLSNGKAEGELIKSIFISLLTSFILFAILYFLRLSSIPGLIPKYGYFIFFAVLSYAIILPSVRYIRSYREFPCMSGMMIGMTIGMISGFLPGFFIGGTNGMFIGSVFGMAIGIVFGVWNGSCCGVMGFMEGIMSGFMGGLMGAMTALMMFNDYLKLAGIIVFIISAVIISGLNYMIYTETKGTERHRKQSNFFIIIWSFILTILTLWLMVYGPRSLLFQ